MHRYELPFAHVWIAVSTAQAAANAERNEDLDGADFAVRHRHFSKAAGPDVTAAPWQLSGFT